MKIIIPTRGRSHIIGDKGLALFPDATLCVGEDEVDAYAKVSDRLLVHPASVVGIGPLRQWVLDHVDDPCVVMVDDDVTHVYSQVGFHKWRIEHADTVLTESRMISSSDIHGNKRLLVITTGIPPDGGMSRQHGIDGLVLHVHTLSRSTFLLAK